MNRDGYRPEVHGCTSCGSHQTVVVDGIRGRRCAAHAPVEGAHLIVWPTDRGLELVDVRPGLAWLRIHLPALIGGGSRG